MIRRNFFLLAFFIPLGAFGNEKTHDAPPHKPAPLSKTNKPSAKKAKALPKSLPHPVEAQMQEPIAAHMQEAAHHHANHFAVFTGVTKNTEGSGLSVGLDYERLATENIGLIFLADQTTIKHHTFMIYGLGIGFHFLGGFRMMIAPSVEVAKVTSEHTTETHDLSPFHPKATTHSESLVRGSMGYDMHWGAFSIGPTYCVDYMMSDSAIANVLGISFGVGF